VSTEAPSAVRRPLLEVRGLRKAFPGLPALDDVSLDVHSGEATELHSSVRTWG
jgi:ABC-type sugar transport system ATPase subunit